VTEQLTRSALQVLAGLPRLRRRCVISFDNDVRVWRPEAAPAELVRDIMSARHVTGATALNTALVTALSQLGAGPGRGVIVLISDGDDVGSRMSPAEVVAAAQASRAVIYPISYAAPLSVSLSPGAGVGNRPLTAGSSVTTFNAAPRDRGPAWLARLAETTGGRVFKPGDGDVDEVLARIAAEVSAQYVVGFPPASAHTGTHKLKLSVSRKDVKIRYRPTFVVAEPVRP
jgi:VWFA-related protein